MKRKFILLILFSLITSNFIIWAQGTKILDISYSDYPSPGYIFTAPLLEKYLTLIDHCGYSVHSIARDNDSIFNEIYDLRYNSNGWISYYDRMSNLFFAIDKNYNLIDSFTCTSQYGLDFHDIAFLPNGNYVLFAEENRIMNLKQYNEKYSSKANVVGSVIQEFDRNHQLVNQWNSFDHIDVMDAENAIDLSQNILRYTHPNSIEIDTDGNWIVSFRHLDAIIKINSTTGDIIWRLGGSKSKNNDFTFINDTSETGFIGFSHQHDARRTSTGTILLFDNGNNKIPQYSRVAEYRLDEINMTAELVWEYRYSPDLYGGIMGGVQRLPNGNTMVSWGNVDNYMYVNELRPDKSKALEIKTPGRLIYRAYKFLFNMDAVERNVTTTGTLNFNDTKYSTNIKIQVDTLKTGGKITVEKHYYQPHDFDFGDEKPLFLLPFRWVVNKYQVDGLKGKIYFNISTLPNIQSINDVIVFYRNSECSGDFFRVNILQVNASTNEIVTKYMGTGEYIIGLKNGAVTKLVSPADSSMSLPTNGTLSWTKVDLAESYTVQIAKDPNFTVVDFEIENIKDTKVDYQDLANFTQYHWRVAVKYQYGLGNWSKSRRFSTIIDKPTLNSPTNMSLDMPTKGTLSWVNTNGADRYQVQLSERLDFQTTVMSEFVSFPSITYSNLKSNIRYYWKVASFRGNVTGGWSDVWEFTTSLASPVLSSPADNSKAVELVTNLNWEKVTGAESYYIQVSEDPVFQKLTMDVPGFNTNTIQTAGLKYNTVYFWRVRASNFSSTGSWSDVWNFNTAIGPPNLLSPENNSTGAPVTGFVTWENTPLVTSYHVQIATDTQFKNVVFENSDITLVKAGYNSLEYHTQYYWRVRSKNNEEVSDWSNYWSFTTKKESALDRPDLVHPENSSVGVSVNVDLNWHLVSKAEKYQVQFSESPIIIPTILDTVIMSGTSLVLESLDNRVNYFWRVRAFSSNDSSSWSDTWRFKTALPYPNQVYPDDNADRIKLDPVLTWELVEDALLYQIQVSASTDFITNVYEQSVSDDYVILPKILKPEKSYFWRLKAIDKEGMSDWSKIWRFTTEKATSVEVVIENEGRVWISPNPVSDKAAIFAELTNHSAMSIKIMDLTGREVLSIPESYRNQGNYRIDFVADNLNSGMYLFVVTINNKTSTGTFIIAK